MERQPGRYALYYSQNGAYRLALARAVERVDAPETVARLPAVRPDPIATDVTATDALAACDPLTYEAFLVRTRDDALSTYLPLSLALDPANGPPAVLVPVDRPDDAKTVRTVHRTVRSTLAEAADADVLSPWLGSWLLAVALARHPTIDREEVIALPTAGTHRF